MATSHTFVNIGLLVMLWILPKTSNELLMLQLRTTNELTSVDAQACINKSDLALSQALIRFPECEVYTGNQVRVPIPNLPSSVSLKNLPCSM